MSGTVPATAAGAPATASAPVISSPRPGRTRGSRRNAPSRSIRATVWPALRRGCRMAGCNPKVGSPQREHADLAVELVPELVGVRPDKQPGRDRQEHPDAVAAFAGRVPAEGLAGGRVDRADA